MSSDPKKRKMDPKQRKKIYGKQNNKKTFMEVGQCGFLVTCNFREKDCIRESYSVLNEFADLLFGKQEAESKSVSEDVKKPSNDSSDDDGCEEIDISKQLEQQIAATTKEFKQKSHRFQVIDNGNITNCIFIKATVPDVVSLGVKIVAEIFETKKARTKNVLRFMPVEVVCKANLPDIVNAAGALFDKYFLKEPHTFAINFNHRFNNQISRDVVIKELAELINSKNIGNKVDLKNAQLTVVVEVLKGFCCLSVLPDFQKFRKYNLQELSAKVNAGKDEKLTENELKLEENVEV